MLEICLPGRSKINYFVCEQNKNFQIIELSLTSLKPIFFEVATMLGNMLTKDEVEDFMREADVVKFNSCFHPWIFFYLIPFRMEMEN